MSLEITKSIPEIHPKGWGKEIWICNNEKYCGKILHFNSGAKFSFHYHLIKQEHFFVLKGKLNLKYKNLTNGEDRFLRLTVGDVIEIPIGAPHQLTALEESDIIEISTTHYENDSYRIEKGDSQNK